MPTIQNRIFPLVVVAAFAFVQPVSAQTHVSEQADFSAEDAGVRTPVPIPADVMDALRSERDVQKILESENIPKENLPAPWFAASSIHLGPQNEVDLVIVGQPPVAGSNVAPFWVFRSTSKGHELVLTAYVHDLIVTKKMSNGYREIKLLSATAVNVSRVLLRFDGSKYQEYRSKLEPIR
jgi:hypothetical protein